ncbi:MAG: GNAT family N-acetyltransferase [Anaerolineales bacterium]|nr:GNAT family N-acetyltransferase [Anaerolineales bacterium]
MHITRVASVDQELVDAFQRLIPQLSACPPPAYEELQQLVFSDTSVLLIARFPEKDSPILGAMVLVVYRVLTGLHAYIEDVIVDQTARGQGIGEALMRESMRIAAELGVANIGLTSNPRREAANRLYQKLGFEKRQTNVYKLLF